MASENKVLFYSEELNQDIYQNSDLLESKKMLANKIEKDNINKNSYNTIVDSIDYLGCINGNCSKIHCDCGGNNEKCECKNNNLNLHNVKNNNLVNNSVNNQNNVANNVNNFVKNLIDFIFILLLVSLLVYVVYKKESFYLLHILGLTLVYIFYKIYIDSRL